MHMFKSYLILITFYFISLIILSPIYLYVLFIAATSPHDNFGLFLLFFGFYVVTAIPLWISIQFLTRINNREKIISYIGICLLFSIAYIVNQKTSFLFHLLN